MNFAAILSIDEFESIFPPDSDGVPIGQNTGYSFANINHFFSIWTKRIEKFIQLDKSISGRHTQKSDALFKIRGFTFEEYAILFNPLVTQDQFAFYPIFNTLRITKGGIRTEKQRTDFTLRLTYHEDDYLKCLLENGAEEVLHFFFGKRLNARLPLSKMKMHTSIIAPTGSGKSELIRAIFYQLQKRYSKFSFILIDPHGDLARKVKRFHLNEDKDRVIYIDPFLKDGYSPTFNVFDIGKKSAKALSHAAEQIIISFEEVLSREGGALSESMISMLEKCIYFLLDREDSTLVDLADLLNIKEDILKEAYEYNDYFNERFIKNEKRSRDALLYRVERLLNSPTLKPLIAGKSTFDLERAMNSGKVIIFNLGELGEMTQAAFGKFLVANIKSLIRKRDPEKHIPTFAFIDECQNLVSGSFEYILSQLRKYGLHMILANQYANQLGDQLEAVKKNTAIKIVGGDEPDDIKAMVGLGKDQISLKDYEYYVKVRGRTLLKVKSPSYLINNPNFQLTKEQEKAFDEHQIDHYYTVTGQTVSERKPRIEKEQIAKKPSIKKPPFDLYLGNDGDTTNQ